MRKSLAQLCHLPASLQVGLASNGAALLQSRGWPRFATTAVAERELAENDGNTWEALKTGLGDIFTKHSAGKRPTSFVITDRWVRLFMVEPPINSTSLRDLSAAAAMRFRELFEAPPKEWLITGDWELDRPFLACALPASLHETLQTTAKEHGLKLTSIAPHFIAAFNTWRHKLDASSWFGVAEGNRLTLGILRNRRLAAVHTARVPEDAWLNQDWLPDYLSRQALILNQPLPAGLQVCGHLPGWPIDATHASSVCSRLEAFNPASSGLPLSSAVCLARSGVQR